MEFLIALAVASIAALLLMVIKLKFPAFIALLVVSVVTALVAGIPPQDVIPLVMDGLGSTLGNVALLVGLGAMLGAVLEKTGGAEAVAYAFIERMGQHRVGPALFLASSVVAVPIFFDVAFIILIPIIYSFSKAAGMKNPLIYGLPLAFMLFIHVTLPPHPGIVGSLAITDGDAGLTTLIGAPICIPVGLLAYYVSKRMTARDYPMLQMTRENYKNFGTDLSNTPDAGEGTVLTHTKVEVGRKIPAASTVIFTVLLPVAMIGMGTVAGLFLEEDTSFGQLFSMIGSPAFALLLSTVVAIFLLGVRNGWKIHETGEIMETALAPAAIVVFVTGAGGVFAGVLTETGIGAAISDAMTGLGIPLLVLAFLLAAILRAAQGSATVSAITTAGLLASTVNSGDFSSMEIVLLNLAIACGAITLSHVNDSGFWIVTRYLGLSVGDGLKTWSVLVTIMGVAGFIPVALLWTMV